MRNAKKILVLGSVWALALAAPVLYAAADQEETSINWGSISSTVDFYYVDDTTNKPVYTPIKVLEAQTSLITAHTSTSLSSDLKHHHYEVDFGEEACDASVAETNTYWDARFWTSTKAARTGNATNKTNCHMYALNTVGCGGSYNYTAESGEIDTLFEDDLFERQDVAYHNVLRYCGDSPHSTVVNGVEDEKPTELEWKWGSSGIYVYVPQTATAFDTPMCSGADTPANTIDNQPWTWTESYVEVPTIYGGPPS